MHGACYPVHRVSKLDELMSSESEARECAPVSIRVEHPASVDAAITSRFSARAFHTRPVAREAISEILSVASRAPSGTNIQPWKVYVLQGSSRDQLVEKVSEAHTLLYRDPTLGAFYKEQYDYYPSKWVSPYIDRRRQTGWGLYGLLGIDKDDKDAMHAQQKRTYRFFDAPVGMMFTIDLAMGGGALLDCGMFIQNIMLAARARGLHSCPQAAWNRFARIVLPHIGASSHEMLVCAVALGYACETAPVNSFHTPREPVDAFTTWLWNDSSESDLA
jgi:nitroreductase